MRAQIMSRPPPTRCLSFFFFNDTATTEIYTLSLHDALPISLALLTYSEVLFLEAEAAERGWITGTPATLYADAIRASMEQYGIATATIEIGRASCRERV